MEPKIGMIVRSMAGRDKGKYMVILSVKDGFVYLADGKERKLGSAKKKNIKHVSMTKAAVDTEKLTDKGLRQLLGRFSGEAEE